MMMMMMPNSADFPFKNKFDFRLQNTMLLIRGKQLVMNACDQRVYS